MNTMFQRLHQLAILTGLLLLPGCSGCDTEDTVTRITTFSFINETSTSANVNAALGEIGGYQNDALQPGQTDEIFKESYVPSDSPKTAGSLSGTVTVGGLSVDLPAMPLNMESNYTITITENLTHIVVTVSERGNAASMSNQVAKVTS